MYVTRIQKMTTYFHSVDEYLLKISREWIWNYEESSHTSRSEEKTLGRERQNNQFPGKVSIHLENCQYHLSLQFPYFKSDYLSKTDLDRKAVFLK